MQYIILDLEWNQPLSYQSPVYRLVGDKLMFEMIQIGAVRLDEQLQPVDQISIPIAPTWYVRIHPRIQKMTGLGPEELAGAPSIREALEQFSAWCGQDYALLTWGCDDVSVLQQNVDFFACKDIPLAPLYDLQRYFCDVHQLKDRIGLGPAMDMLGIAADEALPFHNALNDALYTARIFEKLPQPDQVLKYVQKPKALVHSHAANKQRLSGEVYRSLREALTSQSALHPTCPRCTKKLVLDGEYVRQSTDKYVALARCSNHGRLLIRLRLRLDEDGNCVLTRTTGPATPANVAYVHTKQLQAQQRRNRSLTDHELLPDQEAETDFETEEDRSSEDFDV